MGDFEKSDIISDTEDVVEANTTLTSLEMFQVTDINTNQHIEITTVIQLGKVMTAQNFTPTEDMVFGDAHIYAITAYVVLFFIGLTTNIASLIVLIRNKRNRMSLLLIHLTVADLSVILLQIPLEIAWSATVEWWAGDVACRILVFTRIFGYYLSSFVMIVISVDRFSAIVYPLSHHGNAKRRTSFMLYTAWALAAVCSLPQSFVFSVKSHPMMTSYKQCTTIIGPLEDKTLRLVYGYFCLSMTFFVPLLVMIVCYTSIAVYIFKRSKNSSISHPLTSVGGKQVCMVTSSKGLIGQAKIKTVKLTGVLIIAFTLCWMPFNVLSIWHYVDSTSADLIDFRIQKFSWVFACTNNCFNPLIYGMFQYGTWTCFRNSKTSRRNGLNNSRNPTLQFKKPILDRQLTEKTRATSTTCVTNRKNTANAPNPSLEISIATDINRNPDDFQMIIAPSSPSNFSRMELSVTPWCEEDQL